MTLALAFVLGMAALPTVRSLYELTGHLRQMWRELDYYEERNTRQPLPPLGRYILRVMRVFKRGTA